MAAAFLWLSAGYADAEPADESLRLYAVHVLPDQDAQSSSVYGIYLGRGLILTAAHVVNVARPWVRFASQNLQATVLKKSGFDQLDLALLSVDEERLPISLRMRRMPICQKALAPGRPVIVAIPESIAYSRVMSPLLLPPSVRSRFPSVIKDVATTGNSGSGVFDANLKCLGGIMSRKLFAAPPRGSTAEPKDIAKYFVPIEKIAAFIPPQYRSP